MAVPFFGGKGISLTGLVSVPAGSARHSTQSGHALVGSVHRSVAYGFRFCRGCAVGQGSGVLLHDRLAAASVWSGEVSV